jgi:hypothetical protein
MSGGRKGSADAKIDGFLEQQTRLLELQSEHLHEQRDLQLAHLRVPRWHHRLSIALLALGAAAAGASRSKSSGWCSTPVSNQLPDFAFSASSRIFAERARNSSVVFTLG